MSSFPEPAPGLAIHYAYLWRNEAMQQQQEGRKNRPCLISHILKKNDLVRVLVVPITHTPQLKENGGIEIPLATKKRLGLDDEKSWLVTSEVNHFQWPGYDLRPISDERPSQYIYGFLPKKLTDQVRANVRRYAIHGIVHRD